MDIEQLKKLAHLARINVPDNKLEELRGDLESILGYVKSLEEVHVDNKASEHYNTNFLRDDEDPYVSETFTKDILDNAPETKDGYVKVPKIL